MPISLIEKLQDWLSAYPYGEDCLANICLLPKGVEEVSRQKDILGNTLAGNRCYVNLLWEMEALPDEAQNAERLLKLIQWVQVQSASGAAPQFGDMPAQEEIRTEKAGYTLGTQMVTYTVTLVIDFMKLYKENA